MSGKYFGMLPLLLLCLYFTCRAIDFPLHDFANYYFGSTFLANGTFDTAIYFPYLFNQSIADLGQRSVFASYAPNSPFLALLFLPFTFFKIGISKLIFNLLSSTLFLFGLNRWVCFYKINPIYLLLIPILFFVPIKNELLFGQVYFLLFFLLSESWIAYEKKQFKLMAICLGLAVVLKIFPILLLLVFLFRKQFKPLLYVLISIGTLILISILVGGSTIWLFYGSQVLTKASQGEISEAFVTHYQSLYMFLKTGLVFDATQNPTAILNCPLLFSTLVLAVKSIVVVAGYYVSKKSTDSLLVISYWILAMLLISPYGSTYTFILLLFPFFTLIKTNISIQKKTIGLLLLLAINNVPLAYFAGLSFPFSYLRLLCFLLFTGVVISLFYKHISFKITTIVGLIFLLVIFGWKKNDTETLTEIVDKDAPILIYDYTITQNQLTYFYWNENGKNSKTIPFKSNQSTKAGLSKNQVFYKGKRILSDHNNKLKPMVIDNKVLIYLSDQDRGIGFYNLRKIRLH